MSAIRQMDSTAFEDQLAAVINTGRALQAATETGLTGQIPGLLASLAGAATQALLLAGEAHQ